MDQNPEGPNFRDTHTMGLMNIELTVKTVDLLSDLCVLVADHAVDLVDAAPYVCQLDVLH